MGDTSDGWHTVMPTSHAGIERLSRPQLDAYERRDTEGVGELAGLVVRHVSAHAVATARPPISQLAQRL